MGSSGGDREDSSSEGKVHGSCVALNLLDATRKPFPPLDPNPTNPDPTNPSEYLTSSSHPQNPITPPTPDVGSHGAHGAHGAGVATPTSPHCYPSSNPSFKLTSSFLVDEPLTPIAKGVTSRATSTTAQSRVGLSSQFGPTDVESPFEDEGVQAVSPTAKPRVSFEDRAVREGAERAPPSGEGGATGGAARGKTFEHKSRSLMDPKAEGLSLHGEEAYRRQGLSELLFFAAVGDVERCKKIVKKYNLDVASPECCDPNQKTPLHVAAAAGCYTVVLWLLESGVAVNAVHSFGLTPLAEAIRNQQNEVALLLESRGGVLEQAPVPEGGDPEGSAGHQGCARCRALQLSIPVHAEWEINPRELTLKKKVGQGQFGVVYKADWLGTPVAVKKLRHMNELAVRDFRAELNVLQKIHHPNAVQFLGACTREQPYMIVTDFLPAGSLGDLFKKVDLGDLMPLSLRRAVELALDCCHGMTYLHSRRPHPIIHRDLKPANLMLGSVAREEGQPLQLAARLGSIKIADFGLSRTLVLGQRSNISGEGSICDSVGRGSDDLYQMTGGAGSFRYMAPEVYLHKPYNSKVDVYAFAMICYELFEGRLPFGRSIEPKEAAARAAKGERPAWGKYNRWGRAVPAELKALVEDCWLEDADERPHFINISQRLDSILAHLPYDTTRGKSGSKCPIQ